MGGRGASSGISDAGMKYGEEFKSIFRVDNIKFVQSRLFKNVKVPLETMSAFRNRVYVTVNSDGPKSILFYNKSGKLKRQIDLTHRHMGEMPHVHEGDVTNHHKKFRIPLTKSDYYYIKKVQRIWEEYENGKH